MPQPDFVPVKSGDRVRSGDRLPPADQWRAARPGDNAAVFAPVGKLLGAPGPDQGYGLKLARRFAERIVLADNEHREDAVAGCLAVGLKRASIFGRGPVIYDFELAFTLWGFMDGAPTDLVAFRKPLFAAASHQYEAQRHIADAVPETTLRLTPQDVAGKLSGWRSLISR